MRYHFTPVRMANIKKTTNNKFLTRMWRKRNTVGGNVKWCSQCGKQYGGSQKTKNKTALFTLAKIGKQSKCLSTDEWIKKMWHIYIQWDNIQP